MDLNSIAEKVIVAVIAGIILAGGGFLFSYLFTPGPQSVQAQTDYIDFPNPSYRNLDGKKSQELEAAGLSIFGVHRLGKADCRHGVGSEA